MTSFALTPSQMADRTGVGIDTLRYYEKEGLIRNVARAESGHRRYSEDDALWIEVLRCLRNTRMTMDQLRRYCELGAQGDHTVVRQGKVRYLGCSNHTAWRLTEALWASDRRNWEPFVSVQPEYNLLEPMRAFTEMELAPMCVLPESVRAEENAEVRFSASNWDIIEALVEVGAEEGRSPAETAGPAGWLGKGVCERMRTTLRNHDQLAQGGNSWPGVGPGPGRNLDGWSDRVDGASNAEC